MRKTWKRIVSVMMALAMVVLCLPGYSNPVKTAKAAQGDPAISYIDASGEEKTLEGKDYTRIYEDTVSWYGSSYMPTTLHSGIYVVDSSRAGHGYWTIVYEVQYDNSVTINGDVTLILPNDSKLSIPGIIVPAGSKLTICGQAPAEGQEAGRLVADASSKAHQAGIGGNQGNAFGEIVIAGGSISATGGRYAAGIGSGYQGKQGSITICGGEITQVSGGSRKGRGGAGIGSGCDATGVVSITITGGTISNAKGGNGAAGIGGGSNCSGGNITISGGNITATGGTGSNSGTTYSGAGIGGGSNADGGTIVIKGGTVNATGASSAAGIGGGRLGYGGSITIEKGAVTAKGGNYAAGIGGGYSQSSVKAQTITISGGDVTAIGGAGGSAIGSGEAQTSCGSITISGGTVNATAGDRDDDYYTAAIGGRFANGDKISISGGTVTTHLPNNGNGNRYVTGIGSIRNHGNSNIVITGGVINANGTTGSRPGTGIGDGNGGSGGHVSISIKSNNDSVTANNYGNATVTLATPVKDVTSSPNVDLDAGVVTNHSKINGRKLVKATTYTIEFVNADTEHTPLQDPIEVTPGTHPKYSGATPTLPTTAQYTYTFSGWKDENNQTYGNDEELPAANGSMTYTATYTATVNEYTVTFVKEDGSEISSETYPYNTVADNIAVPTAPEKDPSTAETFEFIGWLNTTTNAIGIVAVTGDVTYKATYKGSPRKYTVTFVDENGVNIIDPVEYAYNTAANAITVPEAPAKGPSIAETFAFTGWQNTTTNAIGVVAVTGDVTYKATYKGSPRKYTVTFKDDKGNTIGQAREYDYNTPADEITVPADPFKDADDEFVYTFSGWSPVITAVTGDATYVATYSTSPRQYSDLEVKAVWDDNGDCDGFRPDSVTVTLLGNGETVSTKALSGDPWTDTFHVPTNDVKGNPITYTIEAPSFDNYEKTVNGFTVTYKHTPETTEASVKVVWVDSNDEFSTRPNDLEVYLSDGEVVTLTANSWAATLSNLLKRQDGQIINYTWREFSVPGYKLTNTTTEGTTTTFTFTLVTTTVSGEVLWELKDNSVDLLPENVTVYIKDGNTTVDTITVSANTAGEWTFTSIDLPKYRVSGTGTVEIPYTVSEAAVPRFATTISGTQITNTLNTCDVTVSISWDDADNQDGYRPNEDGVAVTLIGDSVEVDTFVLNAENNWTHTWTDVPKESDSDTDVQYTVEGATVSEYDLTLDDDDPYIKVLNYQHTPETTEVNIEVVWNDKDNQDGYRPDAITVNLLAAGVKVENAELLAFDQTNSWLNLPKKANGENIDYTVTVEEDNLSEYTVAIDKVDADAYNYTVTLTHEIEKTNVAVSVVWDDADDQDGYRPDYVTIRLLADGDEKEAVTLNEGNNWTLTWTDLDKKAGGVDIDYTVTEDGVVKYNAQITKAEDGTFTYTVTNTHEPEETEVKVSKVWSDADDQDGYRPDDVTINLLADGVEKKTVTLNVDNEWTYTWTKLPKKADGSDINYTVTEDEVAEYSTNIVKAEDGTFTYTVTNTHETEETEVSVTKVWDDADNQDGYRPNEVTINLLSDGEVIDTVKLNEQNGWYYQWTKLDKKAAGKEIIYTVSEDPVTNYTPSIEQDEDGTFTYTVTNKHTTEKVDVTVSKVWEDSNNKEGFRPESVTVHLYIGSEMIDTAVLGSNNEWTFTFEGLEKNANGVAINYTVTEDKVANYSTEITKATDGTFTYTVTNSRTVEYTQVSVEKIWDDSNNKEGFRPDAVTVKLLANGAEAGTATLNADNEWKYTWTDLQKYVNGQEVTFTVSEDQLANYKEPVIKKVSETAWSYTVTNSRDLEETEASVAVVWDDNDNEEGFRPAGVTVNLMKGNAVLESVELNEGNGWSHSWTKLQKYENGAAVDYTVTEDPVANYSTQITKPVGDIFTYTVKNSRSVEKTQVSVEKIWDDSDNKEGFRPESVTVKLLANGAEAGTATLNKENEWKYTWDDLNKFAGGQEITYTVSEAQLANYDTPVIVKVSETEWAYTVTNSRDFEETEASVAVVWDDNDNEEGFRPAGVTVNLKKGNTVLETVELNAENNWSYSWTKLQKYENGVAVNYTVTEDSVANYSTQITKAANGTFTYTVKNSRTVEKTQVSVEKIWDDSNNAEGFRPESVTVKLLANGEEAGTATLNTANEWKHTWTDLNKFAGGQEITYTVSEAQLANYKTPVIEKISETEWAYTVTNSRDFEETEVKFSIVWNDANDQDGYRPANVTVRLLADGESTADSFVLDSSNWNGTFDQLQKIANATEINYTISVNDISEYTTKIEKAADGTFTYNITYSHTIEQTEVSVSKVWSDADDQDGYRPDDVTVNLLAGGNVIDTVKLSEENSWSYGWTKLDKKAAGKDIDYTVTEDEVPEYTAKIDKADDGTFTYTVTNTHKTEETEVKVKKVWSDADNQDGYRPDDVTVNLLADGKVIDTVILSEENNWSYGWTKLDKKAAGKDIDYTVTEDEVPEYTTKIEKADDGTFTYTVTNTHKTEETEAKVKKVWNDADDQDGYRPDDVTVNLLADGEVIDTVKLSDENNWSYGWTKLDKKAAGKDIDYTITEDEVAEYTTKIDKADDGSFTYTVTNSHKTEETEVKVKKVWSDADDQDGYRPDDVTVNLLADGKVIDTVKLSEENSWSYGWTKLDKKAAGENIDYTVTEDEVSEYTTKIEKATDGSFTYTVTNTHTPETTSPSVKVVWDDENNNNGYRPGDLLFMLTDATGNGHGTVTLNSDNTWEATVPEPVDKYENHGTEIEYAWDIVSGLPDGYSEINRTTVGTITTITIKYDPKPTKHPLEVEKILIGRNWNEADEFEFTLAADENNKAGAELPEVTTLKATKDQKTVVFGDITFTKIGTFTFTITETDGGQGGIGYDTNQRTITVKIDDRGGDLYIADITDAGRVTITNVYESKGNIQITANKVLNGRDLTDGEFSFALIYDGNVIQTKSCTKDGKVAFDAIAYSEEDMVVEGEIVTTRKITYTIQEVIPDSKDPKIVYDEQEIKIVVTLTDNQDGTITATADKTEGITFTNVKLPEEYTIKFVDEDGTILKTATYTEGTKAADIAKPADPTKASDGKYDYTFDSWTPAIADVTEDATYTATYKATEIKGVYKYIGEGAPKYTKGSKQSVLMIFKRTENDEITFEKFQGLKTAKGELISGTHYTAKKGSVEITILPDYLETLEVGKTSITVSFEDGDPVTIEFEVVPAQQQTDSQNPATGDQMNYIWIIFIIGTAALAILIFVQVQRRRREEEF
jgi:pilin isopeptide linkage protein